MGSGLSCSLLPGDSLYLTLVLVLMGTENWHISSRSSFLLLGSLWDLRL